jgi:hypothetical protein
LLVLHYRAMVPSEQAKTFATSPPFMRPRMDGYDFGLIGNLDMCAHLWCE